MVEMSNESIQCADCGKHRGENEPLCPKCGSGKRIIDEEIHESLNITDYSTESVVISASTIDIPSSTMATSSAVISKSIIETPKEQRNLAASKLFLEKSKELTEFEEVLPGVLNDLIERKTDSYISRSGDGNRVVVFNNCNIYGSAIGEGDVHSVGMTFMQEWNSLQHTVDIEKLRNDLILLRSELTKKAETDDEFEAAAQVSMALEDLKKANGPSMLKRLKNCGSWVLGTARDIGVLVVSELIKTNL